MSPFGVKAMLIEPGWHITPMGSKENITNLFLDAWNKALPEIREEYGEDYLKYVSGEGLDKDIKLLGSPRVSDVVNAYEHALLGLYPRARYVIGFDAKYIWLPLQWMPEWMGDMILGKLDPERPLPAVLRKK